MFGDGKRSINIQQGLRANAAKVCPSVITSLAPVMAGDFLRVRLPQNHPPLLRSSSYECFLYHLTIISSALFNLQVLQMHDAEDPRLPTGPMHTLLDAAVGLFDVSGFSKIADRLEKEEADAGTTVCASNAVRCQYSSPGPCIVPASYAPAGQQYRHCYSANRH